MLSAALLVLLLGGSLPVERVPAERIPDLPGLKNVGRVAPGIYRGSAPGDEGLDTLRLLGIKTVVNLRHYHGGREEQGCRRRGLGYVRVMLESSDAPRDEDLRTFLAVVTDPARQPVYFHCWRGKDRTGAMCAAYRMAVDGWPLEPALQEMDAYGFYRGWRDLRRFVREFALRKEQFRLVRPPDAPPPSLGPLFQER